MLPSISAIVLSYNKRPYTRLCLEGLIRTDYRPLELVVVDNGSADGSLDMIPEMTARAHSAGVGFTLIKNEENRGAPAARNQGIGAATGDQLLFIDNDCVPYNQAWLGVLSAGLLRLPEAGAVSSRLLYPFAPHRVQFAGCAVSPGGRIQYIGRGAANDDPEYCADREVQCLISACLLMPATLVRDAGGFDEAFSPVQYEDLDLCYRIREKGLRCYVIGESCVYHFENTTTDGSPDINFRYVTIKNGLLFKKRWKKMFEQENGPLDSEVRWLPIQHQTLREMGEDWSPWAD